MAFGLRRRGGRGRLGQVRTPASALDLGPTSTSLSDEEAEARHLRFKTVDPFPDVPPALLNSAHLGDYMRTVALVWPFDLSRRKAASYAMRVGNEIAYYDPSNTSAHSYRTVDDDEEFLLPPNSLVYVRTKERFQLPDYIAARFNLHINLVHMGLLLGTGPVVDPGFIGHLVVPLHNLTRNTYALRAGQDLIWAEFTKTSLLPVWTDHGLSLDGDLPMSDHLPFDKGKSNHEMAWYISKAIRCAGPDQKTANFPANSIPERMADTERAAKSAEENAQDARADAKKAQGAVNILRNVGIVAIVGVGLALGALLVSTYQLVNDTQSMVQDERGRAEAQRTRHTDIDRAVLRAEILLLELCEPAPSAKPAALRQRLVQARRSANELARRDGTPAPFPELNDRGVGCPR